MKNLFYQSAKKISLLLFSILHGLFLHAQEKEDSIQTTQLHEIVVSATRSAQNRMESPVSIEVLDARMLRTDPKASAFEMLENIKGVQILVPSLGFKVFNARGFANTTNVRFVQLADGMDNQAPHIGSPIGSALLPNDLDIASIEIVPGVSAAMYGMNALNGLVNVLSKSPFEYQGFDFQQKTGLNHIQDPSSQINPQYFSESNLRYAKALGSRWAFKINGSFIRAYDWVANNQEDLNPTANTSTGLIGNNNPAYDGVNSYGNESANRRTLNLNGKSYVVARTGYHENQIADYTLQQIKGDAALHFKPTKNSEISYRYRVALLDNIYQRTNRFRLDQYTLQQHGLAYKSPYLQSNVYLSIENTGKSYNIRSMAENIDKYFKSDEQWFSDFGKNFQTASTAGLSVPDAIAQARQATDKGRPQPGTENFNHLIDSLGNINNWDIGAALRVKTYMLHAEFQYRFSEHLLPQLKERTGLQISLGMDYRNYIVIPDGNYFINPSGSSKNLTYYKTGGFVQLNKDFLQHKLKTSLVLRMDKIAYFDLKLNPRFSIVYLPNPQNSIRLSAQQGYRFPSLFEGFSNVNSGGVKRVGGFPDMSNGIFENSYYRTSIDAFQKAVLNDVNKNSLTTNAAIEKNKGLLLKNSYTYIQPEQVLSLEGGYKTLLMQGRLSLDADFYFNFYQNFIAQVEVNIPKSSNPDSIPYNLNNKNQQDRYRMWTNSQSRVYNYGATFGLDYRSASNLRFTANLTYSKLDSKSNNDGLEEAFNTPTWIWNVQLNHPNIYKHLGFGITYRWQSGYNWQSSLATGDVNAYSTLDAQLSYTLPNQGLIFRVGGNNLLNQYYYSFYGGPQIGGFYYASLQLSVF